MLLAGVASRARSQDTLPEPVRAESLRQTIEDRFGDQLIRDLGLTDDQAAKVRGVLATWATKRRTLEREERRLRRALADEMRPGVAAEEAKVTRMVDGLLDGRLAYVQTFRDELKDLASLLTPVQRAQYVLLRDRVLQRVQEIRSQRPLLPAGPRAGLGPRRPVPPP
jgi:Spy/CpxP family protein refolding chaperone